MSRDKYRRQVTHIMPNGAIVLSDKTKADLERIVRAWGRIWTLNQRETKPEAPEIQCSRTFAVGMALEDAARDAESRLARHEQYEASRLEKAKAPEVAA